MAKFRILVPRFWTDPATQDLTDKQARIFMYCVTGREACETQNCTGIYELSRSTFQNSPFFYSLEEINKIFDYFNKNKPRLLQYDPINHMVYVSSLFKHNGNYKRGLEAVIESFDQTYEKAPQFWQQFAERYYDKIAHACLKGWEKDDKKDISAEKKFLEKLKAIREENLSNFMKPISAEGLQKKERLLVK